MVGTALSFAASIGTSTKDLRRVSNQVPPAGWVSLAGIDMMRRSVIPIDEIKDLMKKGEKEHGHAKKSV